MPAVPRPRLLPGSPRWALVVVAAAAALVAAGLVDLGAPALAIPGVSLGGSVALCVGACAALSWRARRVGHERGLWTRLALAALLTTLGPVASRVLELVDVPAAVAALPAEWAPVAAFPLAYAGLVRWNRYRTNLADPNDVLNGLAAVLAVVALLDVVLDRTGSRLSALPWWQLQPLLAQDAALFVLAGTALSMVFLGAMGRDPRTWLVLAAFLLPLSGVAMTTAGSSTTVWPSFAPVGGLLCLVLAAFLRSAPSEPQPTDPTASTVGAFVVIAASTAILVTGAVSHSTALATWCAAAAATGSSIRLLVNVRELSQLAVSRHEALTDELTGLANRRAVLRRVEELCGAGQPVALALLDLDKFKEVNDGLGHAAGDDLLRLVADRLRSALGAGELLGRLGGDEFAVIARADGPRSPAARAVLLGAQLEARFAEPFEVGGLTLHVAVSIGVTHRDAGPSTGDAGSSTRASLLRQADAAMYDAKRSDATVVVYDRARHIDSSGRLAMVEELRRALVTGELVLHHQPQVDIATRQVVGVEALLRWLHPVRGLLGPAEFLPLAEVHGLMGAITDEVLSQAVAQAARWRQQGRVLRVSVNLSASNLLDTELPQRVADLLRAHDLPPSALVLEVTETVLLSDPDRSLAVVGALADLGTTVSIDDFGTGYASLTYLHQLPVAELKLDRSFTADLLTDARAAAIVSSTIALAHELGLRVVAEGVEDPATLLHLRALDCDESQGFLHSPPLPAAELEEWLSVHERQRADVRA
ncbi:bifunctional diguanylate cyclase/phosphodiesterase [Modestobacter sp. VKM Ac-2983]|uniref:putative bifunctional diguanylate cyclase/phosphodiesterase n=1 Tax=Modestobacter sp. VKM Ac-2983 TaxID=3004137 RepID=UPI0022ABAD77|nr:bifunctional diguanylate cyclase/phosphodiesterase [Modestobacter sp. VKM Ac-2983]MCZ2807517.1 bifunctional diguanylate cyclase/phosphodiesterase [Modestobacter sp. VKM Ac-2983]